jgi:sugar lactone lactonase YvrE
MGPGEGSGDRSGTPSRRAVLRLAAAGGAVAAGAAGVAALRRGGTSDLSSGPEQRTGPGGGDDPDDGITIYVADRGNNRVRALTSDGTVRTVAGSSFGYQDGPAASARFSFPFGVAVAASGTILISDQGNDRIREIDPAGEVRTVAGGVFGFADGQGEEARFRQPYGLTVAPDGTVLVADTINHRIRAIDPSGVVTTVAGGEQGHQDGAAADARFNEPSDVAVAVDGTIYVADRANHRIRTISPDGEVRTVAGGEAGAQDGPAGDASFDRPTSIDFDADGTLLIADIINNRIRALSAAGSVSTVAGSGEGSADGGARSASFRLPCGVAVAPSGRVYVADRENHRIRVLELDGTVGTVAGAGEGFADGRGGEALFSYPYALAVSSA